VDVPTGRHVLVVELRVTVATRALLRPRAVGPVVPLGSPTSLAIFEVAAGLLPVHTAAGRGLGASSLSSTVELLGVLIVPP